MRFGSRIRWALKLLTSFTLLWLVNGCAGHDDGRDEFVPTRTATSGPEATATRPPATSTAAIPTATRTNTSAVLPTATSTAVAPTATETSAQPGATDTPTRTATTAENTATPTETSVGELPTATPTNTAPVAPTSTPTLNPTDTPTVESSPTSTATEGPTQLLSGPSTSSAAGLSSDRSLIVIANPDNDSISIFRTSDQMRVALVHTGRQPVAVAILPNNNEAFVANRADATVVKVSDLNSGSPTVSAPIEVGSEPTGLALSPTGARLYVAEFAEGRVSVINTAAMSISDSVPGPQNPRAVAVTNDGDSDDDDETLIVTEYFGEPNDTADCSAAGSTEACDVGRRGRVRLYNTSDLNPQTPIAFEPIDSGFTAPGTATTAMTSPNQLAAVAINGSKIYVTSVSAAPEPPINFRTNVHPVVYVGDLTSHQEDRSNVGSANLARLVEDALGGDAPGTDRFFLEEITDIAFVAGTQVAYAVSRAADALQEVIYDPSTGVRAGLPQIDLGANVGAGPCQNPIAVAIDSTANVAYVNCWVSERLAIVDLTAKTFTTVQSVLPGETTVSDTIRRGRRFYFTGRGRWSDEGEGYSSCGSCHPDGLSDGITWSFAAGPRQTTSMDGSFSHGPGPQKQRIFNWTAIFDEIHDFERNTRGVSGGLGAITTSAGSCGELANETQFPVPADGLGQPVKEIQDDPNNGICTKNWDDIDAFVRTIRPPRRLRGVDPDAAARGAELFAGEGGCNKCHAGAGWTVSRRFWEPSSQNNTDLKAEPFLPPTSDAFWPIHAVQISAQPAAADNTGGDIAPNEVACVLRDVDSFGFPGDGARTDAIERKSDAARTRAQGAGGFNVPSLYGISVGAPYLHHGQALTLTDLFTVSRWSGHTHAGNASFAPTGNQVNDLVNYLLSIDETTPEQQVPTPFDACPEVFPSGTVFRAELTGDQEGPQPVTTDATGEGFLFVSDDRRAISFSLAVTGLDPANILQAHIHVAPAGQNGNIVAFLAHTSFNGTIRGTLTERDLIPDTSMGIATFSDLIDAITSGNAYMNVHSIAHPGGEIRGQIHAPDFVASLSGDQEVPAVTTTATGDAAFFVRRDGTSMAFVLSVRNLSPSQILFAHIHGAPAGVNGDVVVFLSATPFASPLIGSFDANDVLPSASAGISNFTDLMTAMEAGNTYANVHSQAHALGEIRGQIQPGS